MLYRVRYRSSKPEGEVEATVEANSPNEAVVKFCHVCCGLEKPPPQREDIISVFAEEPAQERLL